MKDIELNEGEELCPVCEGEGFFTVGWCTKCQGKGKLDWVEKIVGVKPLIEIDLSNHVSGFTHTDSDLLDAADINISEQITKLASEKLAKEIDEKLLRSFSEFPEHNENHHLRRHVSDNRVISEFMFFPTVKSKDENKKD